MNDAPASVFGQVNVDNEEVIVYKKLKTHSGKVEKIFKRQHCFDPITFTFSENSKSEWESLHEVLWQDIAGHCQQTFENINQQCFALLPQVNFLNNNSKFH